MRPARWFVTFCTLLVCPPAAWANVARGFYEDDAEYPAARARVVANQVALITIPVVGLYWVGYRSAHSRRGPAARAFFTVCRMACVLALWFAASVPLLGGGPKYFLAGSRPPPQPGRQTFLFGPDPGAAQKSTLPETVAGTALSLAVVFGGLWWLRRPASPGPLPAEQP